MILSTIYDNNMKKIPPLKNECEVTGKREMYGLSLKLIGIDEVLEMLEKPNWQDKNILQ